ncbi:hypothetical protein ART_0794 [Arthrobacter sp. PAMC 25486]|uniref:HNH endonuclease signature motif containing protein n=1 Tax=Arthrobacter sp. PAMC 25486 TaxID=1494608 RepID=UPI00053628A8|nr:HNH endonuclease signature motif containing protein [Arthrobacter sp. PAMC 25486]AIY00393.1 hypothetical protein ART_0794 [Arthrobacter sp. PAMC 25486]
MGDSLEFPTDREEASTTVSVAELIDALAFPVIEPLATDMGALSERPPLPVPGESGPASLSQLDGVRALMDGCGEAIAALRRQQNRCAALVAVMVERLESTAVLEGGLLSLDWWQKGCSLDQICAELATILHVSEGVAGRLIEQSLTLVRTLPASMEQLTVGELGWDHAVVIAEETSLLRAAGIAQETIDAFEQCLLGHAVRKTLPSFRSTARRLRERQYPETITARTRRAYADRNLRVSRGFDGMSWLSLYAPSPTIEAIWDQCTYTAQAAQGSHEDRTLAQLRADIAAALLLRQSMDENSIHSPALQDVRLSDDAAGWGCNGTSAGSAQGNASSSSAGGSPHNGPGTDMNNSTFTSDLGPAGHCGLNSPSGPVGTYFTGAAESGTIESWPWYLQSEPDPCGEGAFPDPNRYGCVFYPWQVPRFDDPDYTDPAFREPDPRNSPQWHSTAQLPVLTPAGTGGPEMVNGTGGDPHAAVAAGPRGRTVPSPGGSEQWPPLPHVTPVVLIPVLSMLGVTNEPAWLEGAGPISMEVAQRLASQAGSMLRLLVDPISNQPLDIAPDRYRISEAMRTQLRIRDEYCQFPGCNTKAVNCEVDHVKSFESGGRSIYNNLEHLCAHHHLVKHFKDDKDRHGKLRCIDEPERQGLRLRGWTPRIEDGGRISWTSPSGRYCPPDLDEPQAPAYPKWLKKLISRAHTEQDSNACRADSAHTDQDCTTPAPTDTNPTGLSPTGLSPTDTEALEALAQDTARDPVDEEVWDFNNLPEPPEASPYDAEDNEILTRLAIEHALSHPWLGLAA